MMALTLASYFFVKSNNRQKKKEYITELAHAGDKGTLSD